SGALAPRERGGRLCVRRPGKGAVATVLDLACATGAARGRSSRSQGGRTAAGRDGVDAALVPVPLLAAGRGVRCAGVLACLRARPGHSGAARRLGLAGAPQTTPFTAHDLICRDKRRLRRPASGRGGPSATS